MPDGFPGERLTPPSTRPIHELPVEILLGIFALVDTIDSQGRCGTIHGRGIANLMLVCRQWREVACATPEFWRHIDAIEPLERVWLSLERSKGCTIDVRIFYPWVGRNQPLCHEAIALILPHTHRIRSLYANVDMDDYPAIDRLLDGDMPALERLDIVPIRNYRHYLCDHHDHGYANQSLSRRKCPRLHSLVAQELYMPAAADTWRMLRTLKMCDFPRKASKSLLMRDVLSILKANLALEELVLWWYSCTPKVSPTEIRSGPNYASKRKLLALRKLRVLSVHGTVPCVMELLDHLLLPTDIPYIDIRAKVSGGYAEAPSIDEIVSMPAILIPAHLRFLQERMTDVSFTPVYPESYIFCTPPYAPADPELCPKRTAIAIDTSTETTLPSPTVSVGMRCLLGILGWVPVRRLSLCPPPPPTAQDSYERMFDAFPFLEELEVSGTHRTVGADLFAALTPVVHGGDSHELPRCPHLRTLVVHMRVLGPADALELAETVERCARARSEADIGLHKVTLHFWTRAFIGCGRVPVEDEDSVCWQPLERMRGFVDDVEHVYSPYARLCGRCSGGCC